MRKEWKSLLGQIPGYDPFCHWGGKRYWFDEAEAENALDFFPTCCRHVKGPLAGKPFALAKWQQAVVANLFGWKREDGTRRYRYALIYVPRKNGKTLLAAGIILYVMFCDGEAGAEIYSAAADREQASLVFSAVAGMVRAEQELAEHCKIYQKAITIESRNTMYKPISRDANTKHGFNAHLVVVDELHAQPDRELVDVLETSMGARTQPLMIYLTTADFDRPSICNEIYQYGGHVRDGLITDATFLPVIYEAKVEDDWKDPQIWRKANPNFKISLQPEYISTKCKKASSSPSFENTFRRLHLNIQTETAVRWLSMLHWKQCGGKMDTKGRKCYAGLDMSATRDFSAFVMAFPVEDKVCLQSHFWLPREAIKSRQDKRIVNAINDWATQGWIELTPGDVIDFDLIRRRINELGKEYNIAEIAVDRWQTAQLTEQLKGDGFTMIPFGQGYASMSAPTKRFDTLVTAGKIMHGNNPVLTWMAGNATVESDAADNIKPTKAKSRERIDGIVAGIMAIGRLMVQAPAARSVYETRGILRL